MRHFELSEFIGHVASLPLAIKERRKGDLDRAAKVIQDRAKAILGHYQEEGKTGPFPPWAQLKQRTIEEKERLGYAPPDNPLLREGDLRDSIEHTVVSTDEAAVGSNSIVAVAQELGTSRGIPPRSFLGAAAFQSIEKVGKIVGQGVFMELTGEQTSGCESIKP